MKTLKEVYKTDIKKLTVERLREIITEELSLLKEAEFQAIDTGTNIADIRGSEAFAQLASGDESAPLIQAMMNATGWAKGAIEKAGGVQGIKDWAESVGEGELSSRIQKVGAALPSNAPAKVDMPALEGEDAAAVQDALSPGGKFNVDIEASYAGGEESLDKWIASLSDEDKAGLEAGQEPDLKEESHLREDKYPRHGKSAMPGGGPDPVGKALAFLVKGKHDGDESDDNINVTIGGSLPNGKMIPTQSNILAGKSLLFAFLQGTGNTDLSDMGGAFVTSKGEILDGHHRWSGAYIGTGGGLTHGNVHIVDGAADELIPMLTSIGNALGNPQKESTDKSDDIIMERWRKMAGIL